MSAAVNRSVDTIQRTVTTSALERLCEREAFDARTAVFCSGHPSVDVTRVNGHLRQSCDDGVLRVKHSDDLLALREVAVSVCSDPSAAHFESTECLVEGTLLERDGTTSTLVVAAFVQRIPVCTVVGDCETGHRDRVIDGRDNLVEACSAANQRLGEFEGHVSRAVSNFRSDGVLNRGCDSFDLNAVRLNVE